MLTNYSDPKSASQFLLLNVELLKIVKSQNITDEIEKDMKLSFQNLKVKEKEDVYLFLLAKL